MSAAGSNPASTNGGAAAGWRSWALGRRARVDDVLARALAAGAGRADLHGALTDVGVMLDGVAAAGLPAQRFDALAGACLERAVARVVADRWHARDPATTVLLDWVPRLAPALGADPAPALTDLTTAVTRLRGTVDQAGWRELAGAALAYESDPTHLRAALTVAAWRCGAVRWRGAALAAAGHLPEPVLAGALRLGSASPGGAASGAPWEAPPPAADPRAVLARNARDPWWWPGRPGPWRIGGFRGFGGPWIRIPELLGGDGLRWWVRTEATPTDGAAGADDIGPDGYTGHTGHTGHTGAGAAPPAHRYWVVHADVHGSHTAPAAPPAHGDRPDWAGSSRQGPNTRPGAATVSARDHSYYLHVRHR
ncbi:hypothetical protein EXU48_21475 [Occultella glacieicola]|uniref:Uncharacterized protein n=1 Tax=Occultella glacieicola TaxID=2518684 RepID=A0ABY2DXZ3_9MICO|nr:hypothetical protein [Occultella glacieicola]TDE88888.1 hypothetical protein EXU48_21475 [Occultella glacieicola]